MTIAADVYAVYRELLGPFLDWLRAFTAEHRRRSIAAGSSHIPGGISS